MEKRPTGKGGKDLRKEQGEALRGGKALGGKGWGRISTGKGGKRGKGAKDLKEKEEDLSGRKGRRGERGERISTGKGGERSQ